MDSLPAVCLKVVSYRICCFAGGGRNDGTQPGSDCRTSHILPAATDEHDGHLGVCQLSGVRRTGAGEEHVQRGDSAPVS